MSASEPRPASLLDRPLTRNETIAAAVLVPVAIALVARAASPSWSAVAVRASSGVIFLATVLLYGWIEARRARRFPLAVGAAVILGAGAAAGAIAGALEAGRPGPGALSGLLLGGLWLAYSVKRARRDQGQRGGDPGRRTA